MYASIYLEVKSCINVNSQETPFKNILINICFRWEILRITTYVFGTCGLIDSNVVDTHGGGESEMLKIHKTKIL